MPEPRSDAAGGAERHLVISGYHGAPTPATLIVVTFDPTRRMRRAAQGLLGFWGAMVVSVFIPIAHFVLVPSFFVIGIWQFVKRLHAHRLVKGARGVCPDCGKAQDFDTGARVALPMSVQCRSCHRGLTLAEAA